MSPLRPQCSRSPTSQRLSALVSFILLRGVPIAPRRRARAAYTVETTLIPETLFLRTSRAVVFLIQMSDSYLDGQSGELLNEINIFCVLGDSCF